MAKKRVYFFGEGKAEGSTEMKQLLGGKGANLAEMTNLGVPVPPGFTICTNVCSQYYESGGVWPEGLKEEVDKNLSKLEKAMGTKLGSHDRPLLVSVRSGAAVSMPGMMDTVLNLGLNDDVVDGIIKKTNNPRFAYDIYRRFIDMFGDVVMGCSHQYFEEAIAAAKKKAGVELDNELDAEQLKGVVENYKKIYKKHVGELFPQDGVEQLRHAIDAVFNSWNTSRAVRYRELNQITGLLGTAVNVQAMVFGNMGEDSGTGVCFTRNPSTGEKKPYGEFLMNAQGEDVVAGIRTPLELKELSRIMPAAYKQLYRIMNKLEKHYKDMQDLEFTIQEKNLYLLQTRTGKRTAEAAVKVAADMVTERLIPKKEAVLRVTPKQIDRLLHPHFDPNTSRKPIAVGLPASPGAAVGEVVFDAETAEKWHQAGKKVVLVRIETSPEDIGGMDAAEGVLTARGGMTSHAAVVARGMGKCCVAGAGELSINYKSKIMKVKNKSIKQGDWVSIDGSTGEVMTGKLPTVPPTVSGAFERFMAICDQVRKMKVRANADTPEDARKAREFGAEGIGLCRTEHMFFGGKRIWAVRSMILAADDYSTMLNELADAKTAKERGQINKNYSDIRKQFEGSLKKLRPYQRKDFEGIFKAMDGLPVTIRLLDPPLHEFLPHEKKAQAEMAKQLGVKPAEVSKKVAQLHEFNPMLGHRGCRLAVSYPAIYRMQVRAIIEAALNVKNKGVTVKPEIMIPLVGSVDELIKVKEQINDEIKAVFEHRGDKVKYMVGTMIEVPRAAVTADEIAKEAQFFSFGTNDLTQMTMGFSRDDAGSFLGEYVKQGIYAEDPFQSLDKSGVGQLVQMGIERGRTTRKHLKVGICGEHGGDPASIDFCSDVGMDYVSCSPFRVPIARLAAAKSAIKNKRQTI